MGAALFALWGLLCVTSAGCESGGATALGIQIVDGAGGNPVARVERGELSLRIAQAGATDVVETAAISFGTFDVSVPIAAYTVPTTISVTIEDDAGPTLVGATVPFIPFGYARARIVVGEPGTCVPVATPHLPGAGIDSPALVLHGVNLYVFGGLAGGETPRRAVHVLSPLELTLAATAFDLSMLSTPMGRARGVSLHSPDRTFDVLVVSETSRIVFDTTPTVSGARDATIDLPGAGADPVLVPLGELGVAVVGSTQISVVDTTRTVRTIPLVAARTGHAAARLGDGVLVAGGAAPGADLFEWHPISGGATQSFGAGLAQRTGASVVVSPTSTSALLLLGRGEDGALAPGSVLVTGCPARCAASAGPDVPELRTGALAVARAPLPAVDRPATTLLVGGAIDTGDPPAEAPSGRVESVRWDDATTPVIEAEAGLVTPRMRHAALALGASVVLVAGGTGPSRVLDDLELCF